MNSFDSQQTHYFTESKILTDSIILQPFLSSKYNRVKHWLKQQEIAHPLRYDDINFIKRQGYLLNTSFDKGYLLLQAILSTTQKYDLEWYIAQVGNEYKFILYNEKKSIVWKD